MPRIYKLTTPDTNISLHSELKVTTDYPKSKQGKTSAKQNQKLLETTKEN